MKSVLFVQHNITITSPQWTTSSEPREETTDWLSMLVKEKMLETSGRLSAGGEEVVISSLIAEVILTKPALLHVCGSRVSQLDSLTFIKWSSELKHLQEEQESTELFKGIHKHKHTVGQIYPNSLNSCWAWQWTELFTSCWWTADWYHVIMWSAVSVHFSLFTSNTRVSVEPSLLHHESEPEPEQGGKPAARTQNTESGQCEGHCGGFEHSWVWLQAFNALKL